MDAFVALITIIILLLHPDFCLVAREITEMVEVYVYIVVIFACCRSRQK